MSDTILSISRASAQSKFLKDFYGFTTIFNTWDLSILHDYNPWEWYDVALLTGSDGNSWLLIGVVDADTLMLSQTGQIDVYHKTVLWYRSLSSVELANIAMDANIVYNYSFFPDKVFSNFTLRDLQMQTYNTGSIMDIYLKISTVYKEQLKGESWKDIPQETLFEYSLIF